MYKGAITLRPCSLQTPVTPGFPQFSHSPHLPHFLHPAGLPPLLCSFPTHSIIPGQGLSWSWHPLAPLVFFCLLGLCMNCNRPLHCSMSHMGDCAFAHSFSTYRRTHGFLCYLLGGSYHAQKALTDNCRNTKAEILPNTWQKLHCPCFCLLLLLFPICPQINSVPFIDS